MVNFQPQFEWENNTGHLSAGCSSAGANTKPWTGQQGKAGLRSDRNRNIVISFEVSSFLWKYYQNFRMNIKEEANSISLFVCATTTPTLSIILRMLF